VKALPDWKKQKTKQKQGTNIVEFVPFLTNMKIILQDIAIHILI